MAKPLKLGKTARWILTMGILGVLIVSLTIFYTQQEEEQSQLPASIAQAQQEFITYTKLYTSKEPELGVLEERLKEANSSISALQREFDTPEKSIEISTALFQAAEDANVKITSLSSSLPQDEVYPKEEELNGITYQVFTISVTAEGPAREIVSLINFSNNVSRKFIPCDIQSVSITVPPEPEEAGGSSQEEGEIEEQEPEGSTITLSLKIYARKAE